MERGLRSHRRWGRHQTCLVALGCALVAGAFAATPLSSELASAAPTYDVTIQTAYENTPISVNLSDAVGYELTNDSGHTETVDFTDSLPSGVAIDSPAALTNTAGTGTCTVVSSTANPGAGTVTLSVQVPSETAAGAVCTISVSIVPGSPSSADAALEDSYSGVSVSPSTSFSTTPGGLIVLPDPSLTITEPTNGQVFTLGQLFDAAFSCATTDPLDSVDSFFGTDNEGNQIASGEPIDTVDPGSHSLEVECYSAAGGGYVAATVDYTVGSYSLSGFRVTKAGRVSFRTLVPAGKLVAKVLDGTKVIGTTTTVTTADRYVTTTVRPSTAGLRFLKAASGRSVRVELQASFTPAAIGSGDAEVAPAAAIVDTRSNLKLGLATIKKRAHVGRARPRIERGR